MSFHLIAVSPSALLLVSLATVASGQDLRLWYREPATVQDERESGWSWQNSRAWVRAVPVGNGRIGGMVFGGVPVERIQLNESSLWSGWPQDADNPDAAAALPEIRRLLFEGRYTEAQKLTFEKLVCRGPGSGLGNGAKGPYGSYETLGDLHLSFEGHTPYTDYRRELDLTTAIATVSYRAGGARYRREVFVSSPAQVLVVRLTCDRPRSITFTADMSRPECFETQADGPSGLVMRGVLSEGKGIRYAARVRVLAHGGRTIVSGSTLRVEGANAATVLLAAATNYGGRNPDTTTSGHLARAEARPYSTMRAEHVRDYEELFRRVTLVLDGPDRSDRPTDERLANYAAGERDPGLEVLYFQYGRYLLISSSRPRGLPANLQGIWAESIQTPWNGDYHHNINDQMNYWPAEVTALPECHEPFLRFIGGLVEPGSKTARVQYGLDGWVVHTISNIWGFTSPGEHPSWGQFPAAGAWLCRHLWEHYLYTGDRKHLQWAYPIMRDCARFFLGFLVPEPRRGWLVTAPSNSPENSFRTEDGQTASVCYGPTMDMSILRELFANVATAARSLGRDQELASQLDAARARLAPLQIGRHGQLQEWIEDFEEVEPGHRHISHLYGLHPGAEIHPRLTPDLARAARVTLDRRLAAGGGHTGWSRAWMVNLFARLEDGEEAYKHLRLLLARSTLPNLFDNHPPFQIDGNFGGTAGVAEMLLQSHAGEIALLPALPSAWVSGMVSGLRARGGLVVEIVWSEGRLRSATLRCQREGTFVVRYGNRTVSVSMTKGQTLTWDGASDQPRNTSWKASEWRRLQE